MKKLNLFSISLLFSIIGFSQAYKPMLKENKTWEEETSDFLNYQFPQTWHSRYALEGDTLVDGHYYFKMQKHITLSGTNPWDCCPPLFDTTKVFTGKLIREDTYAKKVWVRGTNLGDTTELLIYDFSVNVADTMSSWGACGPSSYCNAIVDSIQPYILENGDTVRIFYVTPLNFGVLMHPFYVIESIGSFNSFYYPFINVFENGASLNCVKDSGELLYSGIGIGCGTVISINEMNNKTTFNIYPNPNNGEQISITGKEINSIEILNIQGQLIKTVEVNKDSTLINLEDLPKGLYFVKVLFENGKVLTEKLILH
jgi:hypothetical protein